MQIKIEQTIIDEETFVPTLVLKVLLDAEQTAELIKENGREEASQIIGEELLVTIENELDDAKQNMIVFGFLSALGVAIVTGKQIGRAHV